MNAIKIDPTNRRAHLFLALVYMRKKDYPQAKRHTEESLKPQTTVEALKQLASIYLDLADYDKAQNTWEKVVRLNPGDNDSLERLAWLAIYRHNYRDVRHWLSQLIEHNPRNYNYYYLVAMLYEAEGLLPAAISNYEKALVRFPHSKYKPLFKDEEVKARLVSLRNQLQESPKEK